MSERATRSAPPPLPMARLVVRTLCFALASGVAGWVLGRHGPAPEPPSTRSLPQVAADFAALAGAIVEVAPPDPLHAGLAEWAAFETQLDLAFVRHGLALEVGREEQTVAAARRFGRPVEVAALFDLLAEASHRCDHRPRRAAATQVARALDPEPERDALRAALLANGAAEVRLLCADAGPVPSSPRTSALLGMALARIGEPLDVRATWESGALEWPDDTALHLLLAWWLPALDPPQVEAARRHLEAARVRLPESRRIAEALAALPR
ncbi:MAG: hypothetical protein JNL90_06265 [Planctomycetes bacterium]|nr:hypothetical protein [Planctomycetota bacterium]